MNSLGFVEVSGVVAAVDALDIMCKSADVQLVSWERKLGGRLVTLIITGSVSAVNAAVENACASCIKKPVAHAVIANPHPETYKMAMLSAKRLEKKAAEAEASAKKAEVTEKAEDTKAPVKTTVKKSGTAPKKTNK